MSAETPQAGEGFTPIPNPVLEALARTRFSGYERNVLDFLFRKTYGWSKTTDVISLSQFVDGTGILKPHVVRTISRLLRRNIIHRNVTKIGNGNIATYEFNSHFGEWEPLPKSVTLPKLVIQPLPKSVPTIERSTTKEKGLLPPTPKPRTAKVTFDRMTGQFVGLTPELVVKLKSMYPGVDVDQVLREAPDWAMKKQRTDYWGSLKAFCKHELENLKRGGAHGTDQRRGYRPSIEDAIFTGEDCIGGRSS